MRMKWLAVVALWAMLGVIYAAPTYIEVRAEQHGHMAWRIFTWSILSWLVWAALTPAIVWLARQYSLVGEAWKRNLIVHLPAFLVVSTLHTAATTTIILWIKPFDNMGDSPKQFWQVHFACARIVSFRPAGLRRGDRRFLCDRLLPQIS